MRLVLLFLLSVCFVIASGQKVKVHVKKVVSGYKTLEFKDKTQGEKRFTFGASTTGGEVKVNQEVISEDDLEIGLVAESASILEVYEKEIRLPLSVACEANENCIKLATDAIYTMNAKDVKPGHTTITCTEQGGTGKTSFTLKHLSASGGQNAAPAEIEVTSQGKIVNQEISLSFVPEQCVIEKVEGKPIIPAIPEIPEIQLPVSDQCIPDDKCIKQKDGNTYVMNAKDVKPGHTTIKCTENGGEKYKDFSLNHLTAPAGQNAASAEIEVTFEGKIVNQEIILSFTPDKCEIEKVPGKPSEPAIPEIPQILLSVLDQCILEGQCIKLKTEAKYTMNAIEVKPKHTTITCTEKGEERRKVFTLNHIKGRAGQNAAPGTIDVTAGGKIEGKEISLSFGPDKCTIEKATVLAAKVITKKDNCVADENDCFQNIDSAYETTLTLSLFTICVLLGNTL